jgi:Sulfotransferase family
MLPNFLVIGAAKCGTSSLHSYLRAHPQVFTPKLKEINYFAYPARANANLTFWARTQQEYEAFFSEAQGYAAVGEVTPLYLASAVAAENIRRTIPDVKLIAILRDPVDRAYSAFLMGVRNGRVDPDIRAAFGRKDVQYVEAGRYARYLAQYYARFAPEQIKILRFEGLQERVGDVVSDLYQYLGVDASFRPEFEVHNQGYVPRNATLNRVFQSDFLRHVVKPALPDSVMQWGRRLRALTGRAPPQLPSDLRAELRALYRDDIVQLEDLTGCDFSGWRE